MAGYALESNTFLDIYERGTFVGLSNLFFNVLYLFGIKSFYIRCFLHDFYYSFLYKYLIFCYFYIFLFIPFDNLIPLII